MDTCAYNGTSIVLIFSRPWCFIHFNLQGGVLLLSGYLIMIYCHVVVKGGGMIALVQPDADSRNMSTYIHMHLGHFTIWLMLAQVNLFSFLSLKLTLVFIP